MALNSVDKKEQLKPSEKQIAPKEGGKTDVTEIKEVIGSVNESADILGEAADGNVSEKGSAKKEQSAGGSTSQADSAGSTTQVQIIPKVEVMIVEISTAIKNELKQLETEAEKAKSPHELSEAVAKIRHLNFTLANLGTITFEALKALWLKFVKKS